ncbi:hypothetical protein TrRE_jg11576 [Triparma retinervis]|uniref:Uncharacterized protein n=1 Tax=Triparma retinervis TaxID=2557542 RepID=A0A9W7AS78_9STRA|nr:hypothetical protein TrRE_jg11576 [Triparma retinervis]
MNGGRKVGIHNNKREVENSNIWSSFSTSRSHFWLSYRNNSDINETSKHRPTHQWSKDLWQALTGLQHNAGVESENEALQEHLKWVEKRYKVLHSDESSKDLHTASVSRTADALYVLGRAEESVESNNLSSDLLSSSTPPPSYLDPGLPPPLELPRAHALGAAEPGRRFRKRRVIIPVGLSVAAALVPGALTLGSITVAGSLSLPSVRRQIAKRC